MVSGFLLPARRFPAPRGHVPSEGRAGPGRPLHLLGVGEGARDSVAPAPLTARAGWRRPAAHPKGLARPKRSRGWCVCVSVGQAPSTRRGWDPRAVGRPPRTGRRRGGGLCPRGAGSWSRGTAWVGRDLKDHRVQHPPLQNLQRCCSASPKSRCQPTAKINTTTPPQKKLQCFSSLKKFT